MRAAKFRKGSPVVLALAGLCIHPPPAAAFLYKEVREWSVSCSNGLTCTLNPLHTIDNPLSGFGIRRTAAPNAPVALVLPVPDGFDRTKDSASRFRITIDGRGVLDVPAADFALDGDGYTLIYSDGSQIEKLVSAMKAGKTMTLGYAPPSGDLSFDTSLSGIAAGLLYIDEVQDRLKRVDALQDTGSRPAREEAPARDLTSFADLPESIRSDFTSDDAICGGLDEQTFADLGAFEAALGDGESLLGLPCGPGGAYNQPFVFYADVDGAVMPLGIPVIYPDGPTVETSAYNASYDPHGPVVEAFYKGRGLGDCGTFTRWMTDDYGGGPVLVLKEQREKDDCDGNYAGGPEKWPPVWPAR